MPSQISTATDDLPPDMVIVADADSSAEPNPASNYDTPWKIAVEKHFEQFMAFYFPLAHQEIDWQAGYEFLDKEFQAISKDALVGTRHVDKLVRICRKTGQEDWLCIHIEVQVARQTHFAERMFVYNYRIYDRYTRPVASMAVLGDDDPNWLPRQFGYAAMGCEMAFRFPVAKLANFTQQEAALEADPNPFALLTLAYLQNRATSHDMAERFVVKCRLIRLLHARNWDKDWIRAFFLVIDWMMELPQAFALQLSDYVSKLERGQEMEYVSSIERIRLEQALLQEQKLQQGMQQGMQQGESAMLCRLLVKRFGELPLEVQQQIHHASQPQIEVWFDRAVSVASLSDVFQEIAH